MERAAGGGFLGEMGVLDFAGGTVVHINAGTAAQRPEATVRVGVVATLVYSGVLTFILVKLVDTMIGIRVTVEEENTGLDLTLHDERGFNL